MKKLIKNIVITLIFTYSLTATASTVFSSWTFDPSSRALTATGSWSSGCIVGGPTNQTLQHKILFYGSNNTLLYEASASVTISYPSWDFHFTVIIPALNLTNLCNTSLKVWYECLGSYNSAISSSQGFLRVGLLGNFSSAEICSGTQLNYLYTTTAPSYPTSLGITWSAMNNPNVVGESTTPQTSNTVNDILVNNTTTNQVLGYTVTATAQYPVIVAGGPLTCSTSSNYNITVKPSAPLPPTISITSGINPSCQGSPPKILTAGFPNNAGYSNASSAVTWSTGQTGLTLSVSQSGNYSITGTNGCGSFTSNIIDITVNPLPTFTPSSDTICNGGTLIHNLAASEPSTYTWYAIPNSSVIGATSNPTSSTIVNTLQNLSPNTQVQKYQAKATSIQTGCNSSYQIMLYVTISPTIGTSIDHQVSCGDYTWIDGNTYTTSTNTPTVVFANSYGCDSTVLTLNLTINQSTADAISETACESYTLNGINYNSTGTYMQTLTNTNGCDSLLTLNLTITSNIDNTISNTTGTLTAINQHGTSYQWVDCANGNAPIQGQTAHTFTPSQDGQYAVQITAGTCTETSACVDFVMSDLSSPLVENNRFVLFPNPSSTSFTISNAPIDAQFSVLDVTGKTIYQSTVTDNQTVVQTAHFTNGIYFVHVEHNGTTSVEKLMISK